MSFFLKNKLILYSCVLNHSVHSIKKSFSTKLNEKFLLKRSKHMDPNVKVRENPVVFKLENDLFKSIFTPELNRLVDLFKKHGYEIRIAGGAVRDLLMDKIPTDLDFATIATPKQMKTMFDTENIRMINMNGEKHGTITARIHDKENFECTTLRIDVLTDGRHAEVEFTQDWLLDSNRRDLTINAMFLGFDGSVYDYFFGYEDLMERRVKFVGNADTRIKEDFLRILRYFRFYGRIAKSPDQHDPETLKIISNNAEGLQRVSGERIWVELKKILQGNFAGEILMTIIDCGLSQHIGLPSNPDREDFRNLCKNQSIAKDCDPITILAALLNLPEDALHLHERLKFSAYERDLLYFLAQNKNEFRDVDDLIRYQQMCLITSGKIKDIKEYVEELLKLHCKLDLHQKLKEWTVPRFPVTGSLLLQNNCPTGKIVGVVLNKLKVIWVESEFKLTSEELLEHLPQIFKDLNIVDGKLVKKPKTQ